MKNKIVLGIFAHANAGKTTITENLLYKTNMIKEIGRVDSGNTVTDSMKIEKERGITVRDSVVSFETERKIIQLIDTPGHIDFSAEVERAINVLDAAVLVLSGVEGVEAQTYTIWNALKSKNIPTIFFINKIDRDGADFDRVVKEIQEKLGIEIVPMQEVKRIDKENIDIKDNSVENILDFLTFNEDERIKKIIDNYLINDEICSKEEIDKEIQRLSREGKVYPVIGGSALKNIGIDELLNCIDTCLPNDINKDSNDKFSAYVYSVRVENGIKQLYIKVESGSINNRDIIDFGVEKQGKIKEIFVPSGIKVQRSDILTEGDIGIITGIDAQCGEVLGDGKDRKDKEIKFINPLLNVQVEIEKKEDLLNSVEALKVLNDEDPYLNVRYDKNTGKIYMTIMGQVQGQVIEQMMKDRFNIDMNLINPIIIHKEAPTKTGIGEASYTNVSGVKIEIKPLPEGSGLKYESKLSTDFLLKKYQRQAERLIKEYSKQGLYGWELTDAEISLIGGRFDSMGSSPKDFNICIPLALMRAIEDSKTKILEPISRFSICVPNETLNNVIQTISSRQATFEIQKQDEKNAIIEGEGPTKNMLDYPLELTKITSGLGIYSSYISKYETARNQDISKDYIGADPRNEVKFVIDDMKGNLDVLDQVTTKKVKASRSKFRNKKQAVEIRKSLPKDNER